MVDEPVKDAGTIFRENAKADRAAYQQRVKDELDELLPRFERLHNFLNGAGIHTVPESEHGLIRSQHNHMQGYVNVLRQRIKLYQSG